MRWALVNPRWSFAGSIYFGCPAPHLPLEYGYSRALLEKAGHQVLIVDGLMDDLSPADIRRQVEAFRPDFTVITTAPSYLFWRCAPPELRVPMETVRALKDVGGCLVGVGPHESTTPKTALEKLGVDVVVQGECEEILPKLAETPRPQWDAVPAVAYYCEGRWQLQGGPHASDMNALPALRWPAEVIGRHAHHHHRFEATAHGPGAEMEVSRGCPYHCSFCAKENFRNRYRKRPLAIILEELDGLLAQGIEYVYFIDEIFLPDEPLLEALVARRVKFGVQTRIDLWKPAQLELLGRAGCVSIEAGVESISPQGRDLLDKNCRISTAELTERLLCAKKWVPFVQANLIEAYVDDPAEVDAWRQRLIGNGVWANKPVPLFPYPGSPDYTKRWGLPDDQAWERAHAYYLEQCREFSDVQEQQPRPLPELEGKATTHA